MSIKVMTWAWDQQIPGNLKLLLLAISDHASDDGTNAWPSIQRLMEKTGTDRRTVQRNLRKLEEVGFLRVERRNGRASYYTVLMEGRQIDTPPGGGNMPQGGGTDAAPGAAPTPPEPSVNRQEPLSGGEAAAPTVGQRANAVAKAFCDKHKLHSFHGIRAIVTRAIQAGYADQRIADVLAGLADAGKPVTVGTIRWELEGPPRFERQPHTVTDPGTQVHDNGLEVLGAPVMDPQPPNEAFLAARRKTRGVRHE